MRASMRWMFATRCGTITSRSAISGMSARARVTSSGSSTAVTNASSHNGPRARSSPFGPSTIDAPGKIFPPSLPTRFDNTTCTPCSSAMSRASRSHRFTLAGTVGSPVSCGQAPRAGGAASRKIVCAPSSAAIVPVRLCQASSHTSSAARPQLVSNARNSRPRSTKRSSSNIPYVGRNIFRCTCRISASPPPSVT
jgi:hypothetical protein